MSDTTKQKAEPMMVRAVLTKRAAELSNALLAEINRAGGCTVVDLAAMIVQMVDLSPEATLAFPAVRCTSNNGKRCDACASTLALLNTVRIEEVSLVPLDPGTSFAAPGATA